MLKKKNVRWLHLSDFHSGKDDYGINIICKSLLTHIKSKQKPDFVIITGDLSYSGKEKEYNKLYYDFFEPLNEHLGDNIPVFAVPGNHDIDREKHKFITRDAIYSKAPNFFDPTAEGLKQRSEIIDRLYNYRNGAHMLVCSDSRNLWNENGFYHFIVDTEDFKIGLLGINTAWLSEDAYDKEAITPGLELVKAGLSLIDECEYKILIGHHPVDWFRHEDRYALESLFGKNRIIYCHGHKHVLDYGIKERGGGFYLVLQCGAAFQGREEDDILKNGYMWCELNSDEEYVYIDPYFWNKKNQEWVQDVVAFPVEYRDKEKEGYIFSTPNNYNAATKAEERRKSVKSIRADKLYRGWECIDAEYIEKLDKSVDDDLIINYFNGRVPNWRIALCRDVPRREVVRKVFTHINSYTEGCGTYMILGAGGEGKTTALLQIIEKATKADEGWRVLFHRVDTSRLNKKMLDGLSEKYNWIIASDDADLIADDIYDMADYLNLKNKNHIHFLLASRLTDWRKTSVAAKFIQKSSGYFEFKLTGINRGDAKLIVEAWAKHKERGLGLLAGFSKEDAIDKLLEESKSETSQNDGALLGALLRLRIGDQMKSYVKKMLDKLYDFSTQNTEEPSLFYAFVCIAAMHAENMLFLSKTVLANTMGIGLGELRSKIVYPLGEEAAADVAGEMVFTRHRAIAETATDILRQSTQYNIDLDDVYVDLAESAERAFNDGNYVTNLAGWRLNLAEHFYGKGNIQLTIRILQAILKVTHKRAYLQVKLSKYFRLADLPEQSVQVLSEGYAASNDRILLTEWAYAEHATGNYAIAICLFYVSLSDQADNKLLDIDDVIISINGFVDTCFTLYNKTKKNQFAEGACVGLEFYDSLVAKKSAEITENMDIIKKALKEYRANHKYHYSKFEHFRRVALFAYERKEVNLPEWVIKPEEAEFRDLLVMLE